MAVEQEPDPEQDQLARRVLGFSTIEEWLEYLREPEILKYLAVRAALRTAPAAWSGVFGDFIRSPKFNDLALARVLVTSCVYVVDDQNIDPEIRDRMKAVSKLGVQTLHTETIPDAVKFSAASAAATCENPNSPGSFRVAKWAISAALSVAQMLRIKDGPGTEWVLKESIRDYQTLYGPQKHFGAVLWQEPRPTDLVELWKVARAKWEIDSTDWSFWIDWYESLLDGRPQKWEMLKKIVLIPNDDWDRGAEHVNPIINDIRRRYAEAATPNSEEIEVNPDTGRARAVPLVTMAENALQDGRDRMADAARIFGEVSGNNPFGALAPEIEALEGALARYPDRPQRLHDIALQVVRRTQHREDIGDCPEAAKEPLIADFKAELLAAAEDFRRADDEVRKTAEARAATRIGELDADEAQAFPAAAEDLAAVSEGELADELPEDAAIAADLMQDPETRKNAAWRFASRALRIVRLAYGGMRKGVKEAAELSGDFSKLIVNSTKIGAAIKVILSFVL